MQRIIPLVVCLMLGSLGVSAKPQKKDQTKPSTPQAPQAQEDDLFGGSLLDPLEVVAKATSLLSSNEQLREKAATAPTPEIKKELDTSNAQTQRFMDAAAKKFPDNGQVQTMGAVTSSQLGDLKTAGLRADRAVGLGEANLNMPGAPPEQRAKDLADSLMIRSAISAQRGDKKSALEDVARALKLAPDDETAQRLSKLLINHHFHDVDISLPAGMDANQANKDLAELRNSLAEVNAAVVRHVVNRPAGFSSSVSHTKDAETALKMADYQTMYDDATTALRKLPDNPKAYMQRAFAAYMLKNFNQAIKDATDGLKLRPGAGTLLGLRAASYNETGRPRDALQDAVAAVSSNPKDPFAWLQKGLARESLHEGDDGYLSDIKQAGDLNSEFNHFYTEALGRRTQGESAKNAGTKTGSDSAQGDSGKGLWGRFSDFMDQSGIKQSSLYWIAALLVILALIIVIWPRREDPA